LAPEVINPQNGQHQLSSDIFSFGMIIYELYTRKLPYSTSKDYFNLITEVNPDEINKYKSGLIHDEEIDKYYIEELNIIQLKEDIISKNIRPDIPQELDPKMKNIILNCWEADPNIRMSMKDIISEIIQKKKFLSLTRSARKNQTQPLNMSS